jgi:DNA-binding transcriptional MocR family regulator
MAMLSMQSHVLTLLTKHVKLATTRQLADHLGERFCRVNRHLSKMERKGWLESASGAFRQPGMNEPLFTWEPGDDPPSFTSLAYRLDTRWAKTEPTPCKVWWATPKAVAEFGGHGGQIKQPSQVEHDIAVMEVYLRRGRLGDWQLEDRIRNVEDFGGTIPDALLDWPDWSEMVIEIGGQYPASRLSELHDAIENVGLPYELW